MKGLAKALVVVAILSILLGIVSRYICIPLPIVKGGMEAEGFLEFTNTCLLFAITLLLLAKETK